jgi:outer membrane protein assembly factor BamB
MQITTRSRFSSMEGMTIVLCIVLLMVLCTGPAGADSSFGPTIKLINPQAGYNTTVANITNLAGTYFWGSGTTASLMPSNYPVQPVLTGSLVNGAGGALLDGAHSVFVTGTRAYVASNTSDALEIIDVSDPANPSHLASVANGAGGALLDGAGSVYVFGNYAYIASRDSNALEIITIAPPSSPAHVASVVNGTGGYANLGAPSGVFVANNSANQRTYAYVVSTGTNSLQIVDVTNPASPVRNGNISNTDAAKGNMSAPRSIYVSGNYAYIASGLSNGIEIIDISNQWSPKHAGFIADGTGGALLNNPYSIQVVGNYAYIASYGSNALEIVDVTNPKNPKHKGNLVNGAGGASLLNPVTLAVSGIYAYVGDQESNYLEVIDVSNPAAPVHKGSLSFGTGYWPNGIFVSGNSVYVASTMHDSLEIFTVDTGAIAATDVQVTNLYHENAQITCKFPITNKPSGKYSVVVKNPDLQQAVLVNGFLIARVPKTLPEPYPGWKFRGVLNSTGMYNDGGARPNGKLLWNSTGVKFVESTPAVVDGIVYIGGTDKYLYTLFANNGTVKWKKLLADNVYGGPAVVNGTVYAGVGNNPNVAGVFYALNASTGATIWKKDLPGGVRSSPAVYNGTVYVGRDDGNVSAWNAKTGAEVWRFKTASVVFSPAVSNGRVYVATNDWNLFALDATTGAKVWDGRNSSGWDSSIVLESSPAVAYGKVYIGGEYAIYAFDELTGALLYEYPVPGAYLGGSPAVANGLVYIATTGGSPSSGNAIYALNANDLTLSWANHTPENTIMESSPAVANGVVYITSDRANNKAKGFLYAWNAATGAPIWSFRLPGGGTSSSPAVVDGVVYFGQWWDGVLAVGTEHPISVTAPNGGQTWKRGSTQTIMWIYSGSPGSNVKIDLLKGSTVNRVINASTPIGSKGSGTYSWKVPAAQATGADYKIRITSTTGKTDMSNAVFAIRA